MNKIIIGLSALFILLGALLMRYNTIIENDIGYTGTISVKKEYYFDKKGVDLYFNSTNERITIKFQNNNLSMPLSSLGSSNSNIEEFKRYWNIEENKISFPENCNYLVIGIEYLKNKVFNYDSLRCN